MASHPTSLGHVHLKVRTLDRSLPFYTAVLGLAVRERIDRYAFLTYGEHHHDVALQAVGEGAAADGPRVGLYHAAVECPDRETLAGTYERLRDRDVSVTPVDHGISLALYFDDPSGNGLEAYVDTRDRPDEEWAGTNERFDPVAVAERND